MFLSLHRFIKDVRGVAAIEFALIAPLMVTMLAGTVELSNYMMALRRVSAAAHASADLIAQETDITSVQLSEIFLASRLIMEPFDDSSLTLGAVSVRYDDPSGNPSEDWNGNYNGGSVSNPTTRAAGLGNAGESVIIVSATYAYTPMLGIILTGSINITDVAITRPRYADYVGLY